MEDLNPQLVFANPFAFAALISAVFELIKKDLPPAPSTWMTRIYILLLAIGVAGLGVAFGYLEFQKGLTLILPAWLIATGLYAVLKNTLKDNPSP